MTGHMPPKSSQTMPPFRVGIIGGGVAGSTLAEYLGRVDGMSITLVEKSPFLVSRTPFCHLHAGGLLYALNVPESEARMLLYHSIKFASWFPQSVINRPTVVGIRKECTDDPAILVERCEIAKEEYEKLVSQGMPEVLGPTKDYYKSYSRADLLDLRDMKPVVSVNEKTYDDYMADFSRMVDLDSIQYPVVCVKESGIAMVRVGATLDLVLSDKEKDDNANLRVLKQTTVDSVACNSKGEYEVITISVHGEQTHHIFDYLVNATGGDSSAFDALVPGCPSTPALVELKSSYVVSLPDTLELVSVGHLLPEIALLGTRGSPHGMVQITPYGSGYYQIHAMSQNATLFNGGLVKCDPSPSFSPDLQTIVDYGFDTHTLKSRSNSTIEHAAKVSPGFSEATSSDIPLWGVQLIIGTDAEKRSGDAEFPMDGYAKMVIVKGISAVVAAETVLQNILDYPALHVPRVELQKVLNLATPLVVKDSPRLRSHAITLANARNFPEEFAIVGWEK